MGMQWNQRVAFWVLGQLPGVLGVVAGAGLAVAPRTTLVLMAVALASLVMRSALTRVRGATEGSRRPPLSALFVFLVAISGMLGFASGLALVLHARGASRLVLITLAAGLVLPLLARIAVRVRDIRRRRVRVALRM
jgi:hypothetical protein